MKLIHNSPNSRIYLEKNIVVKVVPGNQNDEVHFWGRFKTLMKNRFIIPDLIERKVMKDSCNEYNLMKGTFYFIWMKKKEKTLEDYRHGKEISIKTEKNWLAQMHEILIELKRQDFVHSDIHFRNILIEGGKLFLIDFGLVMHRDFCCVADKKCIYELYLWAFEDFYTFLKNMIFYKHEKLLIQDNDYKKIRSRWKIYFHKNPKHWIVFKTRLKNLFDFESRDDYKICFYYFVNNILSDSPILSPKQGIYRYVILFNLFLDRMFLLFSILHTPILSSDRKKIYLEYLNYKKLM